jgi:hypothetical protein
LPFLDPTDQTQFEFEAANGLTDDEKLMAIADPTLKRYVNPAFISGNRRNPPIPIKRVTIHVPAGWKPQACLIRV